MRIMDVPEFTDKRSVLTFEPDTPLMEAVEAMAARGVGSAVVTKGGKLVGIFTERDLLMKVVGKKQKIESLKILDVMTKNPNVAKMEDDVDQCLRRMSQGRFRHLPIVDEKMNVVGLVSQGDFVAHSWYHLVHHLGQRTKHSFLNNSQLWVLIAAPIFYVLFIKFLFY